MTSVEQSEYDPDTQTHSKTYDERCDMDWIDGSPLVVFCANNGQI